MTDIPARQAQLYGSTAGWAANDRVLRAGEIGVEVVSSSDVRIKIGDGSRTFSALPYASASSTAINAATQAALDAKLAQTGGTMTGPLVLSADPSAALGAATKQYADAMIAALTTSVSGKLALSGGSLSGFLTLHANPASPGHAASKAYVDAGDEARVSRSGDTMAGPLTLAGAPTDPGHAANKDYVDSGSYQTAVGGSPAYAGKVVRLNASGVLDVSLVPVSSSYLGTINPTLPYALSGSYTAGSYYATSAAGAIDASWAAHLNGSPGACGAGQFLIFNANGKWDLVGDTSSSSAIAGKLDKSGGTLTGPLVLAGDPTVAMGAVPKQYADTMLPKAGGAMTGPLILSADPASAMHAATRQYVDAAGTALASAYAAADSALSTSLTISINARLPLSGGTLTGPLVLAGDAAVAMGAVTKQQLDAAAGAAAQVSNNLADLANKTTALANLGGTSLGTALFKAADAAAARAALSLGSLATVSAVGTAQLADAAVSYAKMQAVTATSRVLGRRTAGAGVVEELSLTQLLDFIGSAAQGDLLYRGASGWARLPAGAAGQVLQSNGAGANPSWATPASGGSVLLGILATASGATATLSGLNLSAWRQVYVTYEGVSTTSTNSRQMTLDGTAFGPGGDTAASTYDGWLQLDLTSGFFVGAGKNSGGSVVFFSGETGYSKSSTAIVFGWNGSGNFDAGTVKFYGVP